jgi:hypothetical protein
MKKTGDIITINDVLDSELSLMDILSFCVYFTKLELNAPKFAMVCAKSVLHVYNDVFFDKSLSECVSLSEQYLIDKLNINQLNDASNVVIDILYNRQFDRKTTHAINAAHAIVWATRVIYYADIESMQTDCDERIDATMRVVAGAVRNKIDDDIVLGAVKSFYNNLK